MRRIICLLGLVLAGCGTLPTDPELAPSGIFTHQREAEAGYLVWTGDTGFLTQDDPLTVYAEQIGGLGWEIFRYSSELRFEHLVWNGGDYFWEEVYALNQRPGGRHGR